MTTYTSRTLSVEIDASTQYATVYNEYDLAVGTFQRRRMLDLAPFEWTVYDLDGKQVHATNWPSSGLRQLEQHIREAGESEPQAEAEDRDWAEHEEADIRYRSDMKDAGRGHLLR